MIEKWFGSSPWSDELKREGRVETPHERCIECHVMLGPNDRGVITLCSEREWDGFDLAFGDRWVRVCAYHLSCWLAEVVGGVPSFKVRHRLPSGNEQLRSAPGEETVHEVGRGWHTSEDDDEQGKEGVSEEGD